MDGMRDRVSEMRHHRKPKENDKKSGYEVTEDKAIEIQLLH